jgi:hypothetical protein
MVSGIFKNLSTVCAERQYPCARESYGSVLKRGDRDICSSENFKHLASLGQAAFVWDIATDAITWSDQAGAVFAGIAPALLATGAGFSRLIEPTPSIRSDALVHSHRCSLV